MDDLLRYFEDELKSFRYTAADFAERYPKIASRLLLRPNESEDPHVERLIESFAYLCARIRRRIDVGWTELAQSYLELIYPHFLRPLPAMAIASFVASEDGKVKYPLLVPKNTELLSRPVDGAFCRFRTCYDLEIWPLTITSVAVLPARPSGTIAIHMEFRVTAEIGAAEFRSLRLHLSGSVANSLHEVLLNHVTRIVASSGGSSVILQPETSIKEIGFDESDSILPYPSRSFPGFRLFQEYLHFPEKFLFIELSGKLLPVNMMPGGVLSLDFFIGSSATTGRLASGLDVASIRLGCVPVVNLFRSHAEPVLIDNRRVEYHVIPDVRRPRHFEVFSIDEVSEYAQDQGLKVYRPLYQSDYSRTQVDCYWISRRSAPVRSGEPTQVYLSVVDASLNPASEGVLKIGVTCSNGSLPSRLKHGDPSGDFEIEGPGIRQVTLVSKMTPNCPPPLSGQLQWMLVSHLALNHLSLTADSASRLRTVLDSYNFTRDAWVEAQIKAIDSLTAERDLAPVHSGSGITLYPGIRICIDIDEQPFPEGGAFLFASVLERFLTMYASVNAFTQLTVRSKQRKEALRVWAPRLATKPII